MDETDPILERRAREEKQQKTKNLRNIAIAMAAVAAVLAALLVYVWLQKGKAESASDKAKAENEEVAALIKSDYAAELGMIRDSLGMLQTDNQQLLLQLDSSRMRVEVLMEELQKARSITSAELQKYKQEVGTLRSIMRNYVDQIDSLNQLNQKLTKENTGLRTDLTNTRQQNEELSRQVEDLSGKVASGSVLKASGITVQAYKQRSGGEDRDKVVDASRKVDYLKVSMTLNANNLATQGEVRVYVRVIDPEGLLLTGSESTGFTVDGNPMSATASRAVDYNGTETPVAIYVRDAGSFHKGDYKVEVYTPDGLLGTRSLTLR